MPTGDPRDWWYMNSSGCTYTTASSTDTYTYGYVTKLDDKDLRINELESLLTKFFSDRNEKDKLIKELKNEIKMLKFRLENPEKYKELLEIDPYGEEDWES